jgi:three-Cys-motif partner protein
MPTLHEFGGFWTQVKLERVGTYLRSFTREMGDDYHTIYFDAFAGTGTVDRRKPMKTGLARIINSPDPPPIYGSARRALETVPPFDQYAFVDRDPDHCRELRKLQDGFPKLADNVRVRQGDANEKVRRFCKATDWDTSRAVFFLDPYGMAVEWDMIEAIAETKAADVWYLFPISATLRMLQRHEKPPKCRRLALDSLYFVERLRSVFEWVSEKPLRLFRTNGPLLFHLYFASSIPGKRRAYDTVTDILSVYSEARDFPDRFRALRAERRRRGK